MYVTLVPFEMILPIMSINSLSFFLLRPRSLTKIRSSLGEKSGADQFTETRYNTRVID